eukprot:scaffold8972_cov118-Isochrysis_galbana.AAC.5
MQRPSRRQDSCGKGRRLILLSSHLPRGGSGSSTWHQHDFIQLLPLVRVRPLCFCGQSGYAPTTCHVLSLSGSRPFTTIHTTFTQPTASTHRPQRQRQLFHMRKPNPPATSTAPAHAMLCPTATSPNCAPRRRACRCRVTCAAHRCTSARPATRRAPGRHGTPASARARPVRTERNRNGGSMRAHSCRISSSAPPRSAQISTDSGRDGTAAPPGQRRKAEAHPSPVTAGRVAATVVAERFGGGESRGER